jgi:ribosomal-protein-alanine N-acetyltransferase
LQFTGFADLKTERLYLRKFTRDDAGFVLKHFSDPAVCEYLVDEDPLNDPAQALALIEWYLDPRRDNANRWVLTLDTNQAAIGTCGYHVWSRRNRSAEIGYDLAPEFRRQGFMNEALRAAIGYGFETMDLNRIQAFVHVKNGPSLRVLSKLGFKVEGIIRDKYLCQGRYHDHFCLSLLKREWR